MKKFLNATKNELPINKKTNSVCEIYDIDIQENVKIVTFPYIQNFQDNYAEFSGNLNYK